MSAGPQAALLPDGQRLHLHHGPIDLIIAVDGPGRDACLRAAAARFQTVLTGLAGELPALRKPLGPARFSDPIARRMALAVAPYDVFVTPMAAVAGAVADEVLAAMRRVGTPRRIHINNGGDVAFHLAPGQSITAQGLAGPIRIGAEDPVRGLATSGWRGRSHSLGIADAVTVAARNAAMADVAATLIANAVDLPGHPSVTRTPACDLSADSDLGSRPVTTGVGALSHAEIATALRAGHAFARNLCQRGLIHEAVLSLGGQTLHSSAIPTESLTDARIHPAQNAIDR